MSSLGGFDTCFNTTAVAWPPVTLLFDGMQVTLPEENVVIHSTYGTISCLAMAAAPDGALARGGPVAASTPALPAQLLDAMELRLRPLDAVEVRSRPRPTRC